ncbi:MAG: heat-inducible transcriptional repressor HrcA [Hyphomicrobiaceae bacterium]|nr:heat-inducible transcriptional repressor HrcA [Hyphomicrobiaceae bacterium]
MANLDPTSRLARGPAPDGPSELARLNERSRAVFRLVVETYLATGEPVGSRNLSRHLPMTLSPASVRNVMSDLEQLGLIYAPHTSAGRLPTQTGLRLFVDGLLEIGDLNEEERRHIEAQVRVKSGKRIEDVLSEAIELVSGLSHCAGLVVSEKQISRLKHIEFVPLEPGKALVVLVGEDAGVENRIVDVPKGLPPSALVEATNYLNSVIRSLTLAEAKTRVEHELAQQKAELDALTAKVIRAGLATWSGTLGDRKSLIVRGQSNLLKDLTAIEDLERIRQLFDDLEAKRDFIHLLGAAETADGVNIFIGSENKLFSLSGSSLIVSPFRDEQRKIVGVLGVIGPTRLNYARIIPMVDYTARLVGRLLA